MLPQQAAAELIKRDKEYNDSSNSSALSRKNIIVKNSPPQHRRCASAQSLFNNRKTSMRIHNEEATLEPLVLKPRKICKTEETKIPVLNRIQRQFAEMEKLKNEMRLQVSKLSDHLQVKDDFLGNVCDKRVGIVTEKGTQTGESSQTHHRDQAKLRNSFFELDETNSFFELEETSLISEIPIDYSDLISFSNSPIPCSSYEDISTVTGLLNKHSICLLKSYFRE